MAKTANLNGRKIRKKTRTKAFLFWRRRVLGNRLGDILLHDGHINENQLYEALEIQKETKKHLGTILVQQGIISLNVLIRTLKRQFYKRVFVVIIILFGCLMSY